MMTLHASKHRIKNDKYQLLKVIAINSVIRLQPKNEQSHVIWLYGFGLYLYELAMSWNGGKKSLS